MVIRRPRHSGLAAMSRDQLHLVPGYFSNAMTTLVLTLLPLRRQLLCKELVATCIEEAFTCSRAGRQEKNLPLKAAYLDALSTPRCRAPNAV